ncbi:MAG: hypothetical protein J07HB67_00085, partial [halophilic archaeon J07HB67]
MDEPPPPGASDTPDTACVDTTGSGGWTRRRALTVGALTLTGGCSAVTPERTRPVSADDWSGPGGGPAGRYAGDTDAPAGEPRRRFVTETDGRLAVGRGREPVVHDGRVYAGFWSVVAFDAATGEREATIGQLRAPPVIATETPYRNATLVGSVRVKRATGPLGLGGRQVLVGLNPAPGLDDSLRRRWQFPGVGGGFDTYGDGPPAVVVGDRVIAGGSWTHPDGTERAGVVAVSAADGGLEWAYHVPEELGERQSDREDGVLDWYPTTQPAVRDGTVYAADVLGRVHAVDAET